MDFNLNNAVRLKLLPFGIEILRERHSDLRRRVPSVGPFKMPAVDSEGYSSMQLWTVMQTFGPHIHMGMRDNPFDMTFKIELPKPVAPYVEPTLKTFGYAPGGYFFKCIDCPEAKLGDAGAAIGDKRAWRCETHAQALLDEALKSAPAAGVSESAVEGS